MRNGCLTPPNCLSVILWLLLQFIVYMDFFLVCTSCWGIQLHKPLSLMSYSTLVSSRTFIYQVAGSNSVAKINATFIKSPAPQVC